MEINHTESLQQKVVRTISEFCRRNRENGAWPATESALRAIVKQGNASPFAPAILRYHRRVLIDQVAWDTCLARLNQTSTNVPIKEVANATKPFKSPTERRSASNSR
jgi:hypothetical protein